MISVFCGFDDNPNLCIYCTVCWGVPVRVCVYVLNYGHCLTRYNSISRVRTLHFLPHSQGAGSWAFTVAAWKFGHCEEACHLRSWSLLSLPIITYATCDHLKRGIPVTSSSTGNSQQSPCKALSTSMCCVCDSIFMMPACKRDTSRREVWIDVSHIWYLGAP